MVKGSGFRISGLGLRYTSAWALIATCSACVSIGSVGEVCVSVCEEGRKVESGRVSIFFERRPDQRRHLHRRLQQPGLPPRLSRSDSPPLPAPRFRVQSSGFRVYGVGFGVQGSGFRV